MSPLASAVADYLAVRRQLGFELGRPSQLLRDFVAYMDEQGATSVTTRLAVAWATRPADAHPSWWGARLSTVRVFARYLQTIDPATEVPPADILPARRLRATPLPPPARALADPRAGRAGHCRVGGGGTGVGSTAPPTTCRRPSSSAGGGSSRRPRLPEVAGLPAPPSRRLGGELTSVGVRIRLGVFALPSSAPHAAQRHQLRKLHRFHYHRQRGGHRRRANPSGRVSRKPGAIHSRPGRLERPDPARGDRQQPGLDRHPGTAAAAIDAWRPATLALPRERGGRGMAGRG
jgi:hypothetical protein